MTPFLGERDAAVFDVIPASASIESDDDRLAARSDPSSREKDPVIFEAQAVAAARAAKAAAASAAAAAAASAAAASSASSPSPAPLVPDALSSTRLVSYKVNASTADYEPRGIELNGVKCSVSLAAGSLSRAAAAEATAGAEQSDGGSSDLFPPGLADPTTAPPPTSPVEQPVSASGSQLIGVDGKPLTITG